jgi:hypothetical protein
MAMMAVTSSEIAFSNLSQGTFKSDGSASRKIGE